MPEHAHLLFSIIPSEKGVEPVMYDILQTIKGVSAHRINKVLKRSGRVWQAESFDRMVRDRDEEFERYYEYIALNAVERGLANRPESTSGFGTLIVRCKTECSVRFTDCKAVACSSPGAGARALRF